ncbi:MAG: LysE family translocator [Janthinobacterium lividum]
MSSPIFTILPALVAFICVMSITPGPNNMLLLGSGANHGFRRTLPHVLGISAGMALLVICVALGLGRVLAWVPHGFLVLRIASVAYLLYLAWRIANSPAPDSEQQPNAPFSFYQAVVFQWVNPKAWVMAISAVATFSMHRDMLDNALILALVFSVVNLPCISVWAAFGTSLRRFMRKPRAMRVLNILMALLLVASLYPIVCEPLG